MPNEEELAIVLRGDLAAILRFATNKKNPDVLSEAGVLGALLSQESLVAGHATPDPGETEAKTRTAPLPERRR